MDTSTEEKPIQNPQAVGGQVPQFSPADFPINQNPKDITNLSDGKSQKYKKRALAGLVVFISLILVSASLLLLTGKQAEKDNLSDIASSEGTLLTTGSLSGEMPKFAEFSEDEIDTNPSISNYTLERSELGNLEEIQNDIGKELTEEQLSSLEQTGFFITPAENLLADGDMMVDFSHGGAVDEFVRHYYAISGDPSYLERKPQDTVFITSDFLLHTYHVFVDRTFQYIEQTQFHPKLIQLTDLLFEKSLEGYKNQYNQKLKDSFSRNATFYLIAKVLLESSAKKPADSYGMEADQQFLADDENADSLEKVLVNLSKYQNQAPSDVYDLAKQELELIMKSEGAASSPLYGMLRKDQLEDYTQYKPRSHYEKNSVLRSFWRAMIWYGRNGFLVKSDDLTLDALVQTLLLTSASDGDQKAVDLWESIYLPTVFFVGKSDDLSFYDYADVVGKVFPEYAISYEDLLDTTKFALLKEGIEDLAGPQIQSSIIMIEPNDPTKDELLEETKSFRFMGQRFTPDSFIYSTLTQGDEAPDEETNQKLPPVPTALMAMSIFGSDRAELYLDDWISQKAPKSDKVIPKEKQKLEDGFGELNVSDWTQNMYWSWLYTLRSIFQKYSNGYPQFMQSAAWQDKDLNSSLGSYTELRHDTLLYAKQSYAELGGGPPPEPTPPPVPKGYVEPNLLFFNRIIALAQMTKDGLEKSQVLPEVQKQRLETLIESFKFFREIVKKELQNQEISDDEFEKLRLEVWKVNGALVPPDAHGYVDAKDTRAGIIADIHTAMTMDVKEILYEATGIPHIIYVAVKDANGTRLTRGMTYSYYEFTRPFGERLSDSDWQANIYEGNQKFTTPQVPDWVKVLQK